MVKKLKMYGRCSTLSAAENFAIEDDCNKLNEWAKVLH
jgi:hypothetical protein